MFMYAWVRNRWLVFWILSAAALLFAFFDVTFQTKVPPIVGLVIGTILAFVLLFPAYLSTRGGYVSKDKRVWFINNILAPKLVHVVMMRSQGLNAGQKAIQELLATFWAVLGNVDDIKTGIALLGLLEGFRSQNLDVALYVAQTSKNSRRPHLYVQRSLTKEMLIDASG